MISLQTEIPASNWPGSFTSECTRTNQCCFGILYCEQVGLVALCSAINYADRVNISIAVVDMKQTFHWDMATQGLVLSSFFWGCE